MKFTKKFTILLSGIMVFSSIGVTYAGQAHDENDVKIEKAIIERIAEDYDEFYKVSDYEFDFIEKNSKNGEIHGKVSVTYGKELLVKTAEDLPLVEGCR